MVIKKLLLSYHAASSGPAFQSNQKYIGLGKGTVKKIKAVMVIGKIKPKG